MSLMNAFSGVSPARLRKPQDPNEIVRVMMFEGVFGPRPEVTEKPGGAVKMYLFAARNRYEAAKADFAEFIPLPFGEKEHTRIVESTGGRVVAWKDKQGREFLGITGLAIGNVYNFPAWLIGNENVGDWVSILWTSLIAHGAYLNLPADVPDSLDAWDRIGPGIREANERNKPAETA